MAGSGSVSLDFEHVNVLASIFLATEEVSPAAPGIVASVLDACANASDQEPLRASVLLADPTLSTVRGVAKTSLAALKAEPSAVEDVDELAVVLAPLRQAFRDVHTCLLFAASPNQAKSAERTTLLRTARRLAQASEGRVVVILSENADATELFRPVATLADALERASSWPAVLAWSRRGKATRFIDAAKIEALENELSEVAASEEALWKLLDDMRPEAERNKLIHLSDLQFGASATIYTREVLTRELAECVSPGDVVVVTGNFVADDAASSAASFRQFIDVVASAAGRPAILVPGVNEYREQSPLPSRPRPTMRELLDRKSRKAIDLIDTFRGERFSDAITDERLALSIVPFNTVEANRNRGQVSKAQLQRASRTLKSLIGAAGSLRVALMHHAPVTRDEATRTWERRMLAGQSRSEQVDEAVLGADGLLEWCARERVSAVLHGHVHQPSYFCERIGSYAVRPFEVAAVGSASSVGFGGVAPGYVVLRWNPTTRRLSTTFRSREEGGGFVPRFTSLRTAALSS